jgi:hypothetical protein
MTRQAKGREVEEAAIDCKIITTQTTVTLPLSLKCGNGLSVKKFCILAREFAVSIKRHIRWHVIENLFLSIM